MVAAAIAAATYGLRELGGTGSPPEPTRVQSLAVPGDGTGYGAAFGKRRELEVDRLVAVYEEQIRIQPSTLDLTFLGQLYLQRGQLTGDPAAYARALNAFERAVEISPEDPDALGLLTQASASNHRFRDALLMAEDRLSEAPEDLSALAVIGDSSLELGDIERATGAYAELARLQPEAPQVMARLSRLAWLQGDVGRATSLGASADASASSSGLVGTDLAWYRAYRAQLELEAGHYSEAIAVYRSALRMAPRYHLTRAGLAEALTAAGRWDEAIRHYRVAVRLLPDPTSIGALGDLYEVMGRSADASELFAKVEEIATQSRASERLYNRQLVVFLADHGIEPDRAVELAEAELRARKDVYGWDAYAWALYAAGRYPEARAAADKALSLGTPDAHLIYHSGMIAAALGDVDRARTELGAAIGLSPAFDPIHSPIARRTLDGLSSA